MLENMHLAQKKSGSIIENNIHYNLQKLGNLCFWLALSLEILMLILDKSSYIVVYLVWWYRLVFLLLGIKFVTAKANKKEWITLILLGVIGLISKYTTDKEDILRAAMIIGASAQMDLKKVMKVSFFETLTGCIMIAVLSLFGIGGVVKSTELYRGGGIPETRYMFGMGHPGACHCMFLMLLLLWTYVYFETSKWWHHIIALMCNAGLYYFTDCNQAFMAGVMVSLAAILLKAAKSLNDKKWIYVLGLSVFALCVGFSVFAAKVGVASHYMRMVDHYVLNGRLQWGHEYGNPTYWSLFGQEMYQEFFDMGWIRLFYWYGIIPALLYVIAVAYMFYSFMKKKDSAALIVMTALSLYTLFEAHIMSQMVGRNYMLFFLGFYVFRELKWTAYKQS